MLLAAMRDAALQPVPKRPDLYTRSGNWVEIEFGTVVAIDLPMIAVRLRAERLQSDRHPSDDAYLHAVVPVSAPDAVLGSRIIGDGIAVTKIDDVLVCRYFPCPYGPCVAVGLGDDASVDQETSATLRANIANGTAEWFPARPAR